MAGALAPLGDAGVDEVLSILEPSVRTLWASAPTAAARSVGKAVGSAGPPGLVRERESTTRRSDR